MAGGVGADLGPPDTVPLAGWLFGEDQARYVVATNDPNAVMARAREAGIVASLIGRTGGNALTLGGQNAISLAKLRHAHERWMPAYMAGMAEAGEASR